MANIGKKFAYRKTTTQQVKNFLQAYAPNTILVLPVMLMLIGKTLAQWFGPIERRAVL